MYSPSHQILSIRGVLGLFGQENHSGQKEIPASWVVIVLCVGWKPWLGSILVTALLDTWLVWVLLQVQMMYTTQLSIYQSPSGNRRSFSGSQWQQNLSKRKGKSIFLWMHLTLTTLKPIWMWAGFLLGGYPMLRPSSPFKSYGKHLLCA